jgi:hypothetical protein
MADAALSVYNSLDRMSHSPSKSTVRRWLDKVSGMGGGGLHQHAKMGALAVRSGLEAGFTGGVLGVLNAELVNGLDFHKVPIDGAVALVGLSAGAIMAGEDYAQDAIHIGAAGAAIYSFRLANKFVATKKVATATGEFGRDQIDPIVAAARKL